MSLVRKALFFPTILYNVIVDTFSTKTWFNRIDAHVVLGALPFRRVLPKLQEAEKIGGIISMNQDFELHPLWYCTKEELDAMKIELLQLPVVDYTGTPTQDQILEGLRFIDRIISEDKGSVYIHCKAGRSRSAMLAAAYLIANHEKSVEEAVTHLREKRPQVWIGIKGRETLDTYYTKAMQNNSVAEDRAEERNAKTTV